MGNYESRQLISSRPPLSIQQPPNTKSIYLSSKLSSLEEYFLLENPNRIHLQLQNHEIFFIWLEPRSERNEHLQARQIFKQELPRFNYYETFDEVKEFLNKENGNTVFRFIVSGALENEAYRFISRNRSVDEIIIFSQNPSRILDITTRYKKTNNAGYTLKQVLRSCLLHTPSNYQNNFLFFCQEDLPLIKNYCLNYYSFVHHRDNIQSKQDFIDLASILFKNNNLVEVQGFDQDYIKQSINLEGKENFLQSIVFRNSFYWEMVSRLPKVTNDPKRLGYLRFAFKDLFEMIRRSYKQGESINFDTVYVVGELTEAEMSYFNENRENYMMFTSFVKGFKDIKNANECIKKLRTPHKKQCLFEIVIPKKIVLKEDLDFGFMIANKCFEENPETPTILFNIFNIFKITNVETKYNRIFLTYGALGEVSKMEETANSRERMNKNENELMKNFDIFECSIGKIRNQISVFNQSGCYIDSIISSNSAIAELHRVENIEMRNQRDLILLEKGNSERLNGNFDDAIKTLLLIENEELRTLGMIRIVSIELKRNNIKQTQQYFEYILPRINQLRMQWGLYEYHYLARHYHSVLRMTRGEYNEAYESMKMLKDEIIDRYDYKIGAVEFFDEIILNMDTCCQYMNNLEQ